MRGLSAVFGDMEYHTASSPPVESFASLAGFIREARVGMVTTVTADGISPRAKNSRKRLLIGQIPSRLGTLGLSLFHTAFYSLRKNIG